MCLWLSASAINRGPAADLPRRVPVAPTATNCGTYSKTLPLLHASSFVHMASPRSPSSSAECAYRLTHRPSHNCQPGRTVHEMYRSDGAMWHHFRCPSLARSSTKDTRRPHSPPTTAVTKSGHVQSKRSARADLRWLGRGLEFQNKQNSQPRT